jgi:Fur family ferric uptake transcriptional regulator
MSSAETTRPPCGRAPARERRSQKTPVAQIQDRLRKYVESQALKNSESRNKIVEVIAGSRSHFNAQELVKRVVARAPEIGAATVYRNIPLLLAAGVLQESLVQETGETLYELSDEEHHDHIVCVDCGAIFEFHDEVIEKAQDKVIGKLGFMPVRHKHVIYAKCGSLKSPPAAKKGSRP